MKVFLIIAALCLAGWSIEYEDRIGDFNEKRWKEATSIHSPSIYAKDIRGNKVKYSLSIYGPQNAYISVMIVSKTNGVPINIGPYVSVREPNGRVTKYFGSEYAINDYATFVYLSGKQILALVALIKKHRKLKMSVMGAPGNYVFDLDCRGFTKAWRKTGWR